MKKCIYCKATANPGYSCSKSPTKYHCIPLLKKCAYCSGGLNPGYPCTKSPTKYHVIIYPGKCTYCKVPLNQAFVLKIHLKNIYKDLYKT